ncbi:hypothetical protein [Pseudomonas sp. S2.OTC.A_B10]|uniref:hypothetical protein n=1 Tax=Pseudomonas sp. S2.OTC.A_B10 TaxID=3237018 RepID=UPI003CF4DFCF
MVDFVDMDEEMTARADVEHVLTLAMAARKAEMKRCLNDRQCWSEQAVVTLVGFLKVGCFFLVLKVCAYLALVVAGISLASEPAVADFVNSILLLLVGLVIPLNPKGVFFRNVFAARAGDAFDAAADAAFIDLRRQEHRAVK